MTEIELIMHAAIKTKSGMILLGKCHSDCFHQATHIGVEHSQKPNDQGFFTSRGRYVERKEAMEIAYKANQVSYNANFLISEMLWSERDAGRHKYDSVKGYYIE